MDDLLKRLTEKKKKLDGYRPFNPVVIKDIDDWLRIELTYNSNAIEGNTLSRIETMLVVEKGITAKGKSLVEHQEAINHAKAFDYVIKLVEQGGKEPLQKIVFGIHSMILDKINDDYKGRYRDMPVRILGSSMVLPNPIKVPDKMDEFYQKLTASTKLSVLEKASMAHYELVKTHPFIDGNGRTARLLMNYILMLNNYAPALIKKEERKTYIDALEEYHSLDKPEKYHAFMYRAIERGLDEYLKWFDQPTTIQKPSKLLKIGELARETKETLDTLRHWTEKGLLEVAERTEKGYQLFDRSMIERSKEIRRLQKKHHLPLAQIRKNLSSSSA